MPPETGKSVETRLSLLERRQSEIWATIHSGNGVEWKQSIRGQLHEMRDFVQASRNLEHATRNIKQSQRKRLDTWLQVVIAFCAVFAVATPYILHFAG